MPVKVLILEDNPVARSFLCRVVRESFSDAIAITEAGDLETHAVTSTSPAAPAACMADPFKLILVDLELPDGNGMELLAELAQYPATKIVTTLYSDDDHLFPALQCGADGYLLKEDRFEVLVEELQKIVRGQPPLSPAIARRLLTHFRHAGAGDAQAPAGRMRASGIRHQQPPCPIEKVLDHERLTPRESEVLTYLSKGFTIKEIASLMGIKWFTVNDHIKSIYKKLNVSSRAEAAVLASKQGLVCPPGWPTTCRGASAWTSSPRQRPCTASRSIRVACPHATRSGRPPGSSPSAPSGP
jgi:two-component system nitrate/nitrite response regulator NarL